MKRRDLWKLSIQNVFSAPVRSLLTVLGISIGIGAVLAVLTLGDAGKQQVRSEMSRLGIDRIWLTASGTAQFCLGDGALLAQSLHADASEQVYLMAEASRKEVLCQVPLIGCDESYLKLSGLKIVRGRMLYPLEWMEDSTSVLMGIQTAERLAALPGDHVVIAGAVYTVRGIVEADGAFSRVSMNEAVYVPLDVLCRKTGYAVQEIMLSIPDGMTPQTAAEQAQETMQAERQLSVDALTMQTQMEAADSVISVFVDVLQWVAIICILVGGIGVMNILLVNVRERKREIGIMKSLGTTRTQICLLFLMEALTYALMGGLMGIVLGVAITAAAGTSIGLTATVNAADCMLAAAAAALVGLVSGVWPAYRASCLNPVDALRSE